MPRPTLVRGVVRAAFHRLPYRVRAPRGVHDRVRARCSMGFSLSHARPSQPWSRSRASHRASEGIRTRPRERCSTASASSFVESCPVITRPWELRSQIHFESLGDVIACERCQLQNILACFLGERGDTARLDTRKIASPPSPSKAPIRKSQRTESRSPNAESSSQLSAEAR